MKHAITLVLTNEQLHFIHGVLDKERDVYIDMDQDEIDRGKKGYKSEIDTLDKVLTEIEEVAR